MTKQEVLSFTGIVVEVLPNAFFRVRIEGVAESILCHISGKMRKNHINVLIDDLVDIEVSPYDITKGRIVFREKR